MKIKILKVYEQNNQLRIEVETPYGKENLGLGLDKKYLDPETEKPKWMSAVRELLEKKYGTIEERNKKDLRGIGDILNKEMELKDLAVKKNIGIDDGVKDYNKNPSRIDKK